MPGHTAEPDDGEDREDGRDAEARPDMPAAEKLASWPG
jgi:hypothetical protein